MSIYEYDEARQRQFDRQDGYDTGYDTGEERLGKLVAILIEEGKVALITRVTKDKEYRTKLYEEYNI